MNTINITTLKNKKDQSAIDQNLSYSDFSKLLTTFPVDEKHSCPAFIGGHLSGKKRLTSNLHSKNLLILDLDSYKGTIKDLECDLKRDLGQYKVVCYSTASHTPDNPRIRIILFFEKEVSTSKYPQLVTNFLYQLSDNIREGIDVSSSTTANKIFYLPIKPYDNYQPWTWENSGQLIVSDIYDYEIAKTANETDQLLITTKQQLVNDISVDEIKKHLDNYPANQTTHDEWIAVGLALHHRFEGKKNGLLIWNRWSEIDKRYPGFDHLKKRWDTMGQKVSNPITFATIIHRINSKQQKQASPTLVGKSKKCRKNSYLSLPIDSPQWFHLTESKKPTPKPSIENLEILLKEYQINVKFDVIKKQRVIFFEGKKDQDFGDALTKIENLCTINRLNISDKKLSRFCKLIANDYKFNSWKDWIESKKWDGLDRLPEFYETIKVLPEYEELKHIYLRKWLLQMIHATCLNDGDVPKMSRMVLTFQGNSSIGKTSWVSLLTPKPMEQYGLTGMTLDTNKDMNKKTCLEHVIVELGELASTYRRSDIDSLKNFISATTDKLDIKYLPDAASYRRMTVFCGTVNEVNFLKDQTGNTRFLCLPVLCCDWKHTVDMQQLYAQLLEYAHNNPHENYNLTKEETVLQTKINNELESISPIEELLSNTFDMTNPDFLQNPRKDKNIIGVTNILLQLGYSKDKIGSGQTGELSRILAKHGFKHTTNPRGWYMPPKRIITPDF
jgi:putative DNA primase/helicase